MKRLILLLSTLLLVGGAGVAFGDTPSPEPQQSQPSATTPATTTPKTVEPTPVKILPWKPPRVLKPGDLVRIGSTPEVCGVIQYPTYKTALSIQPMKQPIIGAYCWATSEEGTPVPNGRIYFYEAWRESARARESTSAGTAQWQGIKKIFNVSFPPPLGRWPKVTGDYQLTQAQKQGRITAVVDAGYRFKVKGTTIFCHWDYLSTGAQVDCGSGRVSYHLAFGEPWYYDPYALITNQVTGEETRPTP